jgi:hypothetical protein
MKTVIAVLVLSLVATLASALLYQRQAGPVRYEGVEPGWSYTNVLAGGWPLPFLYDSVSVSPVGSVSLIGEDDWHGGAFAFDFACYAVLFGVMAALARKRRPPERRDP